MLDIVAQLIGPAIRTNGDKLNMKSAGFDVTQCRRGGLICQHFLIVNKILSWWPDHALVYLHVI